MSAEYLLGVMGWPVSHSRSPGMHAAAARAAGFDIVYARLAVAPDRVGDAVRGIRALGFRGCNVTVPHKVAVMPFLDRVSPASAAIGAVNTIVNDDGILTGENTDADGAFDALERAGAPSPAGRDVLVLGAGGAARAAAYGAGARGAARVFIENRTRGRAEALCHDLAAHFPTVAYQATGASADYGNVALLLQMSAAGMGGEAVLPVDPARLPVTAWVLEAVYSPLETALRRACHARGMRTVDGLEMLVAQGARSFQLWTGVEPDRAAMRDGLG